METGSVTAGNTATTLRILTAVQYRVSLVRNADDFVVFIKTKRYGITFCSSITDISDHEHLNHTDQQPHSPTNKHLTVTLINTS